MNTAPLSLLDLVVNAIGWDCPRGNLHIAWLRSDDTGASAPRRVTEDDWRALHPQLLDALYLTADYRLHCYHVNSLTGPLVRCLVHHYLQPWSVPTAQGAALWVKSIENIDYTAGSTTVDLGGWIYEVSTRPIGVRGRCAVKTTPYVKRATADCFTVTAAWMEDNYPGWEIRYWMAKATEIDEGRELVDIVCQTPMAGPVVSLADMRFD